MSDFKAKIDFGWSLAPDPAGGATLLQCSKGMGKLGGMGAGRERGKERGEAREGRNGEGSVEEMGGDTVCIFKFSVE